MGKEKLIVDDLTGNLPSGAAGVLGVPSYPGSMYNTAVAVNAFLAAIKEAEDIRTGGEIGERMDELLVHAKDLLYIIDEEIRGLDRNRHRAIFEAVPVLRTKLEALRDRLRGGRAH